MATVARRCEGVGAGARRSQVIFLPASGILPPDSSGFVISPFLQNTVDNCRRHNRDATLLIIDIDHFKSINDTWGHDVGDEAIVALTRQLQITLRGSDVIGRFGGDEFAVIMSGTPAESAITAMLRVHEGLNTLRLPNTPQVTLRISVGVAPLNPQMSHYREWLKSADLALYKAKKAGRNRTEVAA